MLLSGDEIKERVLIEDASNESYRAASYDLHVASVFLVSRRGYAAQ